MGNRSAEGGPGSRDVMACSSVQAAPPRHAVHASLACARLVKGKHATAPLGTLSPPTHASPLHELT